MNTAFCDPEPDASTCTTVESKNRSFEHKTSGIEETDLELTGEAFTQLRPNTLLEIVVKHILRERALSRKTQPKD